MLVRERVIVRFDEPTQEELAQLSVQHWVWLLNTDANRLSAEACWSSASAADKSITIFGGDGWGADNFYESLIELLLDHHSRYSRPYHVFDFSFSGEYDYNALTRAAKACELEYVRTDEYGRVFRDIENEESVTSDQPDL